jgi:hypothetical protein
MSGAIGASAVFAGSEAVPCGAYADDEAVHAASSKATNSTAALPTRQVISSNCPRLTTSPNHPSAISSSPRAADRSIGHFDLLRVLGFDPGALTTTRLDPAANPDASASQTPQIKTRRYETALVSFQDRNRNVPICRRPKFT